jgi:hypothetical protein
MTAEGTVPTVPTFFLWGLFSKTQNRAENAFFGGKLHFGKKR